VAAWYILNIKERIMTHFTTDEHGNRTFTHAGWTVRIWSPEWTSRISVESPHSGEEIELWEPEGLWVNGESSGGWEGPSPRAVTIPWPVIEAVIAARAIVAG
jgi:hypothetical protein